MNDKKKIFLFTDWYEPGFKAGGPIRSCVNFVSYMRKDYDIYVFTSDRDLGSAVPYHDIKMDEWNRVNGSVSLYYCSPGKLSWQNIRRQLIAVRPDFVYLNSMFSLKFTIYPLFISRMNKLTGFIILSPRGMLRESAVQFKPLKKKIFLHGIRWLGFHRSTRFHAVDEKESKDVHHYFGPAARVTRIPNFPANFPEELPAPEKKHGELSMIFIGRIHPIKNLDYLLNILKEVRSVVRLTIIGSLEDRLFWEKCCKTISGLPAHVQVNYAGERPNEELPEITAEHHIFALPTKGENFGHAIFEALALGKPVLISDQTPWRNLEAAKAGWDLPLEKPELFLQAIEQAAAFGPEEYDDWRRATRQYAQEYIARMNLREEYLKLFS